MQRKIHFIFLFVIFLNLSCSQIRYTSENSIPTYISGKDHHSRKVKTSGIRKFYLWGLIPREHVVNLDEELSNVALLSSAKIEVEEYQEGMDTFMTYLTLGLYRPVRFKITSWGVKD